jgi:hypothetical protein
LLTPTIASVKGGIFAVILKLLTCYHDNLWLFYYIGSELVAFAEILQLQKNSFLDVAKNFSGIFIHLINLSFGINC